MQKISFFFLCQICKLVFWGATYGHFLGATSDTFCCVTSENNFFLVPHIWEKIFLCHIWNCVRKLVNIWLNFFSSLIGVWLPALVVDIRKPLSLNFSLKLFLKTIEQFDMTPFLLFRSSLTEAEACWHLFLIEFDFRDRYLGCDSC